MAAIAARSKNFFTVRTTPLARLPWLLSVHHGVAFFDWKLSSNLIETDEGAPDRLKRSRRLTRIRAESSVTCAQRGS